MQSFPLGTLAQPLHAAVSADSRLLAVAFLDGVRIFELETGVETTYAQPRGALPPTCLAWAGDSVLMGYDDGSRAVLSAQRGLPVTYFVPIGDRVTCIAATPEGHVVGLEGGRVYAYSREPRLLLAQHEDEVSCLLVDGQRVFSGSCDRQILCGGKAFHAHDASVQFLVRLGSKLVSAGGDSRVVFRDLQTEDAFSVSVYPEKVAALVPHERGVVVVTENGLVRLVSEERGIEPMGVGPLLPFILIAPFKNGVVAVRGGVATAYSW